MLGAMADFRSAMTKLGRAREHLNRLKEELVEFNESNSLTLRMDKDFDTADKLVRRVVVADFIPPPDSWGPLIGDAVANMRAALDHAVWALVVDDRSDSPSETDARKVQFPIHDTASAFGKDRLLQVANQVVVDAIEQCQPYNDRDDTLTDGHPLETLRALSNIDKHRALHVVSLSPARLGITTTPRLPQNPTMNLPGRELHKGAELATWSAWRPSRGTEVKVEAEATAWIVVRAVPPTLASPVALGVIYGPIVDVVENCIDRLSG